MKKLVCTLTLVSGLLSALSAQAVAVLTLSPANKTPYFPPTSANVAVTKVYNVKYSGDVPATYSSIYFNDGTQRISYLGGTYPGTGGTCGTTISADCTIVLEYSASVAGIFGASARRLFRYNNGSAVVSAEFYAIGSRNFKVVPTVLAFTTTQATPITADNTSEDLMVEDTRVIMLTIGTIDQSPIRMGIVQQPPSPYRFAGGLPFPGQGGNCGSHGDATYCTVAIELAPEEERLPIVSLDASPSATSERVEYKLKTWVSSLDSAATEITLRADIKNRLSPSGNFRSVRMGTYSHKKFAFNYPDGASFTGLGLDLTNSPGVSFAGGSFPGTGGTCGTSGTGSCMLILKFSPASTGNNDGTAVLTYTDSHGAHTLDFPTHGEGFAPTAANVLVVYNSSDTDSINVKNYYVANRPEFSSVNTLGISTTNTETIALADYPAQIGNPIKTWITDHPSIKIDYIVMMYGLPRRPSQYETDIPVRLLRALADPLSGALPGVSYESAIFYGGFPFGAFNLYISGFTHQSYPGTLALVTYMNMGSVAATKAYIDKLAATYNAMSTPSVIISGLSAGTAGSVYAFDDVGASIPNRPGAEAQQSVLAANPSASITLRSPPSDSHITTASNVAGYFSWGYNGGLGGDYANDGTVQFSGNSSWYPIQTIESYNGQESTFQGNYVDWFSANAFGGSNYSHTPAAVITHADEPTYDGINAREFFGYWERGYLFIEAAWATSAFIHTLPIGDPLITR